MLEKSEDPELGHGDVGLRREQQEKQAKDFQNGAPPPTEASEEGGDSDLQETAIIHLHNEIEVPDGGSLIALRSGLFFDKWVYLGCCSGKSPCLIYYKREYNIGFGC